MAKLIRRCIYRHQGLLKEEFGILQTPHEGLPAFRLVIVSDDRFLDGTAEDDAAFERLPPYLGNVSSNILPLVGTLQANAIVHLGSVFALAHDLQRLYSFFAHGRHNFRAMELMNSVRKCVRQHWNTPRTQQLLARGGHWFPSVGVLRALLTDHDIPVSFLKVVQQILAEYEQVGDFRSHSNLPSEKYLYRLQKA